MACCSCGVNDQTPNIFNKPKLIPSGAVRLKICFFSKHYNINSSLGSSNLGEVLPAWVATLLLGIPQALLCLSRPREQFPGGTHEQRTG